MRKAINHIIREENFLSLAGNLVVAVFGFAVFAIIARSYAKEVFGEWVLFISSAAFVEMFRFGITNTAIVRYLSGANSSERVQFIGSNSLIGLAATIVVALLIAAANLIFGEPVHRAGYGLFFTWYPLLAFLNLPYNNALALLQSERKYGKILMIKIINSGGFFIVVLVNYLFLEMSIGELLWALIALNAVSSAICSINSWDGMKYIRKATVKTNRVLLNFGKYTTFTLIGTNLLRSADTLIISLSPLGTAAVALYSIPLKLTELQQIPLRSFAATAFPKMSRASILGKVDEVRKLFYTYAGAISILFVLVSLFTFIFADLFVLLLGGREYLGTDPVTGFNAVVIVRIFSVYGLLLPIDRMTGIGLDSINKPGINAIKVFYMLAANIVADVIAIFMFRSLELVAVGSVLFTVLGILIGFYYLDKEINLKYSAIFNHGFGFYRSLAARVNKKKLQSAI